jgi:biuret amidohydrolase
MELTIPEKRFHLASTALIVIDMQNDFCSAGYYMDQAGYDINRLRMPISPIQNILDAARRRGLAIMFTRQHRLPSPAAAPTTDPTTGQFPQVALKGEPGWELIPELTPQAGEAVLDKTACSAFVGTDMQERLRDRDITTLVFCGNTIDVCVHSTLRSANDLGYDCITVDDCCGAVSEELHRWSLESIKVENGVFGDVIDSRQFVSMLETAPDDRPAR